VDRLGARPPRWRGPFPVEGRVGTGRSGGPGPSRAACRRCIPRTAPAGCDALRAERGFPFYGGREIGMTAGLTAPTRRPTRGLSVASRRVPRVSRLCGQGGPDR
jgi:hypothetical protein